MSQQPRGKPLPVAGIVRVSMLGDRGEDIRSPEIQRAAIVEHAQRHGRHVIDWVEALDQSGSQRRSAWWPTLNGLVERVEKGELGGIVAWKFSRFARNRLKWAEVLDRIESAGGVIESATEPVDVTTSSGKLLRGVTAEFNAFYADQVAEQWAETHRARVEQGLPPHSALPVGWMWEGGRVVPHPTWSRFVVEAFERFEAGKSARSTAEWLNAQGVPRARSTAQWATGHVRPWLDSPIHAGLVQYRGDVYPGAHAGLVTREVWEKFRAGKGERRNGVVYLCAGWVVCDVCRRAERPGRMRGRRSKGGWTGEPVFSFGHAVDEDERHTGRMIPVHVVDDAVKEWLGEVADDVENVAMRTELAKDTSRADVERLTREVVGIDEKMATLTVRMLDGTVPHEAYVMARDRLQERRATLAATLAGASEVRRVPDDPSALARGLLGSWDVLPLDGKRAILRELVREVRVDCGRKLAWVVPVWQVG